MKDELTKDELEFAETAWEVTQDMVREGDPYAIYIWKRLQIYSPGNRRKQARVLGFLNEFQELYPEGGMPDKEARILAEKWDIEDLLLKEKGFNTISLS